MVQSIKHAISAKSLEGRLLGGYRLRRLVGKGGMGWVFHAFHEQLQVESAVKILFPQLAEDELTRERFLREARIQFQLQHPNIVRVVSLLDEGGYVGFASDWCSGGDLHQWLEARDNQPVASGQLRSIALPLLEALSLAHNEGIVHRDLKLSNIMLSVKNERVALKLTDFGIAKHSAMPGITSSGAVMGTLGYMAPEQLNETKNIDHRADIYSFGVILYVLLSGRFPFEGEGPSVMFRILENEPPPIKNIPEEAHAIVQRCLRKQPEERFSSCHELAEVLKSCLEPEIPLQVNLGTLSSMEAPSGPISADLSPAAYADTQMGGHSSATKDMQGSQEVTQQSSQESDLPTGETQNASSSAARIARVLQSVSESQRTPSPLSKKTPSSPPPSSTPVKEPSSSNIASQPPVVEKGASPFWRFLSLFLLLLIAGAFLLVSEPEWLMALTKDGNNPPKVSWKMFQRSGHSMSSKQATLLRKVGVSSDEACRSECKGNKSCSFFVVLDGSKVKGKAKAKKVKSKVKAKEVQSKVKVKKGKLCYLFQGKPQIVKSSSMSLYKRR